MLLSKYLCRRKEFEITKPTFYRVEGTAVNEKDFAFRSSDSDRHLIYEFQDKYGVKHQRPSDKVNASDTAWGLGVGEKKILWYSPFVPYLLDQEPLEFKMFMDRRRLTPGEWIKRHPILTVGCIAFIVWIGFRGYKFGKAQIFIYTHDGRNLKTEWTARDAVTDEQTNTAVEAAGMEREELEKKRQAERPAAMWPSFLWLTVFQILTAIQLTLAAGEKASPVIPICFLILTAVMWLYAAALRLGRCGGFELETIAFYLSTLSLAVTASSAPGSLPKQLLAILLGVCLFLALGLVLRNLERVKKLRWLMGAGAVGLLGITLVLGRAKFGATNWVTLGGISFQPSEIAKICYIFAGSATLERLFRRRNLALFIVLTGVCIGLLGLMSDFGTAAIFFVTFLVIAYLRSGDWATLALICGGAAFGAGIIVQFKPYILSRFAAWGHAWEAASGSGYQQTRTMSAAASGGLFGMGAGNGWLERIPAGDTDLVFGMLCEEWGLVIALLAVACILTLAWFAVRASRTGRSSFYTIAACAAGSLLVFQTSLNVFGSVDLLPLTGVTFPFVSNGGSAMLSAWGLLAYLKAMDTRADASFAIGRAAERKLDEEAARMAAPAEDAFEKEDGHAED